MVPTGTEEAIVMSQLVVKPGMPLGAHGDAFDAAARHARQQVQRIIAGSMAAIGRIRSRLPEPAEHYPHIEPAYFESARMAREMYRL